MYYHLWFVTKYRKPVLEGETERKIKEHFLEVISNKNYKMLALETNKDYVHMLLEAKDKAELVNIIRILKSVSAKKILEKTPRLRVGDVRHFWARGFGYKIVYNPQLEEITEYIRNQKRIPHT